MKVDLSDLNAFVAVARARRLSRRRAREAARSASGPRARRSAGSKRSSASGCSTARRAVSSPTEAGQRLAGAARPGTDRGGGRASTWSTAFATGRRARCSLNVPVSARAAGAAQRSCRRFLAAYPDIRLEVIAEESFVDVLAAGCRCRHPL